MLGLLRHSCVPLARSSMVFTKSPMLTSRSLSYTKTLFNKAQADSTITPTTPAAKPDLSALKLSSDLYAVLRIHGRKYLVTEGDVVNLGYHLKNSEVGDVLRFNDVTTIGSRTHTYTEDPVDPSVYSIKATIIEKTKSPLKVKEVTKRRNRRARRAKTKTHKTVIRISELKLT